MKINYIRDRSVSGLEKKVSQALSEGWKLYGDLTFISGSYIQTMTLLEE